MNGAHVEKNDWHKRQGEVDHRPAIYAEEHMVEFVSITIIQLESFGDGFAIVVTRH